MLLRLRRALIFLAGSTSAGAGIAVCVIRPRPVMPSAGFTVALGIAAVLSIVLGSWLIWISLRGSNEDVQNTCL